MNKSSDALISRILKGWTGQHRPPVNARARLIWEASHQTQGAPRRFFLFNRSTSYQPPLLISDEWARTLFYWVDEHTFQAGAQARVI